MERLGHIVLEKFNDISIYLQTGDIQTYLTWFVTMLRRYTRKLLYKPEVIAIFAIILCLFLYHQYTKSWWRATYRMRSALLLAFGQDPGPEDSALHSAQQKTASWDTRKGNVGVYAIQGRRQHMEDRYNLVNDFEHTGTSVYGIFDGHGGEFAADFAEKALFRNIMIRLLKIELQKTVEAKHDIDRKRKKVMNDEKTDNDNDLLSISEEEDTGEKDSETNSITHDENKKEDNENEVDNTDSVDEYASKGDKAAAGDSITKQKNHNNTSNIQANILTEEILNVDRQLLNVAKSTNLISGTTALVAMLKDNQLTVANVGDSRGVICDHSGNTIPLSFDHKPQQVKERKRIKEAGGFISFNGVWRVAGVLATSRALGDYPLKERNLVIAEPDILTFDLGEMRPEFLILATDGLWDTFTNDEAVAYVRERLDEPHFGAKSITLQAYYRGSLDNITVMVVNFNCHRATGAGGGRKGRRQGKEK